MAENFQSLQSLSVSCFQVILGLPGPRLPIICMSKAVCTVGAVHVSIPAEPSLFQDEVLVSNAEPCSGPDVGNVLFNIADLSDHCSVISLQTLEARFC